jgi:broad specificity phosphatase PhoE
MNIVLIRHAQSLGNLDNKIYYKIPDYEVPLSEKGIKDAENLHLGKAVPLNINVFTLYYSPFIRCIHTKNILFPEQKGEENPLLIERQWGTLRDIVDSKEFEADKHFNFFYRPPNGESFFDAYQRVIMFFDMIRRNHDKSDSIIIISHGEWIRLALMYLTKTSVEDFHKERIRVPNLGIFVEYDVNLDIL